jgi:tRNA(Ile)-lysidine synthase
MGITEAFRIHIGSLALGPGQALVAVSGGPDSVALLDLLVRSRDVHGLDLIVAHADHGIHQDSPVVAEQVRALATSYGLPVHVGRLALGPEAGETRAREQRYAWLEAIRVSLGAGPIFTAHHAGDQVETVLMRALVGSGPAGLAGMAVSRGHVVRPLLSFSREELLLHLEETGLTAWQDPANSDPRHLRSWIRTGLLPVLRQRLPQIDTSLLRLSRHASRDRAAWDAVLNVLPELDVRIEHGAISVAAPSVAGYDSPLAQAIILAAARRAGCQLGPSRVGRVLTLVKSGSSGARVPLGGGWTAELSFGRLCIGRDVQTEGQGTLVLEGQSGEGSWGRWGFRWSRATVPQQQDRAAMSAWFTFEPLTVRAWSPGEKLKPLGGTGHRLVVRCFQEVRVPRGRRWSWPVLAHDQEIVWIPGVCRSDVQLPSRGTEALRVDAEYA